MTTTRAGVTRKSQPRPSEMKPRPLDVRKLPERWSNTTLGLPVSPEHCSFHATHNPTEDAGGGGPVRHPRMPPRLKAVRLQP
ncbi:hypothetical protein ANANG_G00207580 [Anguilla anguilla]|uniref:Uncharacterized protein n=1 Tax=Anguilla anguilla TaxID=7936 RepID=A0A9D3M2W3_ANGAN|nr:hypothetical protein ANANG_G00207580 [Anguilla anguilla]